MNGVVAGGKGAANPRLRERSGGGERSNELLLTQRNITQSGTKSISYFMI